jgi:hypothetical protein
MSNSPEQTIQTFQSPIGGEDSMAEEQSVMTPNSAGETLPAVIEPEVIEPAVSGKKKRNRIEREIHHRAFAFYFALGPSRTLAKVAAEFKLKEATILNWSSTFGWKERVIELESRSKETTFRELAMDTLNLVLKSLLKKDRKTGTLVLANTEKATVEKLKMCIDSFKRLRDDTREEADHEDGDYPERGTGRKTPGVMVNVIFKG